MTTAPSVYHYTDTARLPWILQSGELRPGKGIGFYDLFPKPDFLWAATSDKGDRTASALRQGDNYRNGKMRLVRFELSTDDFEPWVEARSRFPDWTPEKVEVLERAARGLSDPSTWLCRAEALPAVRWRSISTRSYTNKAWVDLPLNTEVRPFHDAGGTWLTISIAGRAFTSRQRVNPNGQTGYDLGASVLAA